MTLEQRLKMILGEQQFAIASLMSQIDSQAAHIEEMKKSPPIAEDAGITDGPREDGA